MKDFVWVETEQLWVASSTRPTCLDVKPSTNLDTNELFLWEGSWNKMFASYKFQQVRQNFIMSGWSINLYEYELRTKRLLFNVPLKFCATENKGVHWFILRSYRFRTEFTVQEVMGWLHKCSSILVEKISIMLLAVFFQVMVESQFQDETKLSVFLKHSIFSQHLIIKRNLLFQKPAPNIWLSNLQRLRIVIFLVIKFWVIR